MDPQQLAQAILIAGDPGSDRALQQQAIEFLNRLNSEEAWPLALSIFVDAQPDGTRTHSPQVRLFALRILSTFLGNR